MTALELGVDLFQGFYFAKPGGSFDSVEALGIRVEALRKEFTAQTLAVASLRWHVANGCFSLRTSSSQILLASKETREDLIRAELVPKPRN